MAKPVGNFPSQTAARNFCKEILNDAREGVRDWQLTNAEREMLVPVFERHPEPKVALADAYEVGENPKFAGTLGWLCFVAIADSERTPFSYDNAITSKYKPMDNLRLAVKPQIDEFAAEHGRSEGEDVDHIIPFVVLVRRWCSESGYTLDDCVSDGRDGVCKSFAEFHKRNARLRILASSENRRGQKAR